MNEFYQNLNSLLELKAPELRYEEDGVNGGFIFDDNENKITTFPILEYEERYLLPNESVSYIYLTICCHGQCKEIVRMKSNDLFSSTSYIGKFGNKPFVSFDENSWMIFFKIISIMLPEIEEIVTYQYSGWDNSFKQYLFGTLLVDAENTYQIRSSLIKNETVLSEKNATEMLRNVDDIARNLSKQSILPGYIALMYLMNSHSKQRFVSQFKLGPEFTLGINGLTGTHKSSSTVALFNTCDSSTSSFEDTLASIRRQFQSNKSGVTLIDDYKISSASNDAKYEKIVRLSGDIQTSGKYVVGNKVVDDLVTGMSVITGEIRPKLQASSYSRILFWDLSQFPINVETLTRLQKSKADINSFIVLFVQLIMQNDDFDKVFCERFLKHRDELRQNPEFSGMHGRYYSMYAWMVTMWECYVALLNDYGITVAFDFKKEISNFIYKQNCYYDNNPVKLFKVAYYELTASNEIITIDSTSTIDTLNFDVIEFNDKIFIKSGSAFKKICAYWKEKGMDFPCKERQLRKLLHEEGILETYGGKFTTEKKTRENKSFSGYFLLKNIFKNYGGNENEEL